MRNIQITVAGLAGTGKSTIIELIRRTLEAEGIEVAVDDDVPPGFSSDSRVEFRLKNLKPINVSIESKQMARASVTTQGE